MGNRRRTRPEISLTPDTAAELLNLYAGEDTAEQVTPFEFSMYILPRPDYYDTPEMKRHNARSSRLCHLANRDKYPEWQQGGGPLTPAEEKELQELHAEIVGEILAKRREAQQ